jgi:hypothetical protein
MKKHELLLTTLIFVFIVPGLVFFPVTDPVFSQELYDYSSASGEGDFYDPTEYMDEAYQNDQQDTSDQQNTQNYDYSENTGGSIEMDVTDEYYPDGYYEPYDFNYIPGQTPDESVSPQDNGNVSYDYQQDNYDTDTYIPQEEPPVYEEPLQVEMETFEKETVTTQIPDESVTAATDSNLLPEEKKPIRFMINRKNPKRFIIANLDFNRALKKAFYSRDDNDWLKLNGEMIKIYADLNSTEPSYPEIYEEFEKINSVLVSFAFSGAYGARDGAILKWNNRLLAVVGPISTKIKVRKVKKEQLVSDLTEVLGGKVTRTLPDGTYYVILGSLLESVQSIMSQIEDGEYKKVSTLSKSISIAGAKLKKMLGPFMNLLKLKFIQRVNKDKNPKFQKALEILKI